MNFVIVQGAWRKSPEIAEWLMASVGQQNTDWITASPNLTYGLNTFAIGFNRTSDAVAFKLAFIDVVVPTVPVMGKQAYSPHLLTPHV